MVLEMGWCENRLYAKTCGTISWIGSFEHFHNCRFVYKLRNIGTVVTMLFRFCYKWSIAIIANPNRVIHSLLYIVWDENYLVFKGCPVWQLSAEYHSFETYHVADGSVSLPQKVLMVHSSVIFEISNVVPLIVLIVSFPYVSAVLPLAVACAAPLWG